jgi:hypothetical protein
MSDFWQSEKPFLEPRQYSGSASSSSGSSTSTRAISPAALVDTPLEPIDHSQLEMRLLKNQISLDVPTDLQRREEVREFSLLVPF